MELLEAKIGRPTYPDENDTSLEGLSKQVSSRLVAEGCNDKAAIVAAALGDLPYDRHTWKKLVIPAYGTKAGNAWHEMCTVRMHGHFKDCVRECNCPKNKKCEHSHVKGCNKPACLLHRIREKAPYISGPARVALLAWFAVLSERVSGDHAPEHWNRQEKADYLYHVSSVTKAIADKGSKVKLTPIIHKFADKIDNCHKKFV